MFKILYTKYLKKLLIFSIIITVIYIVLHLAAPGIVSKNLPFLIIVFLIINAIVHYIVVKTDVQRMEYKPDENLPKEEQMKQLTNIERKFITHYMLLTTVKLLGFLVLLVLYAMFNRPDFLLFAANFLVLYVLYSVFEIIYIKKPVVRN